MKRPMNRTIAGLLRILNDPETAVQVVSFTGSTNEQSDAFGVMRPGVDYWPRRDLPTGHGQTRDFHRADRRKGDPEAIRFVNTTGTIALMWPASWTYQSDDDGHEVIATRQSREGGARLVLRLYQPNILAANWSESLEPDRIENDDA